MCSSQPNGTNPDQMVERAQLTAKFTNSAHNDQFLYISLLKSVQSTSHNIAQITPRYAAITRFQTKISHYIIQLNKNQFTHHNWQPIDWSSVKFSTVQRARLPASPPDPVPSPVAQTHGSLSPKNPSQVCERGAHRQSPAGDMALRGATSHAGTTSRARRWWSRRRGTRLRKPRLSPREMRRYCYRRRRKRSYPSSRYRRRHPWF